MTASFLNSASNLFYRRIPAEIVRYAAQLALARGLAELTLAIF
jgi:hypothetical protein